MTIAKEDAGDTLDRLDEVANAGVSRVTVEGVDTYFNLGEVNRRRRELREKDSRFSGKRPVSSSLDLSGF